MENVIFNLKLNKGKLVVDERLAHVQESWKFHMICLQYYDVRKKCEGSLCYDFSNAEKFLNKKSVRESLGVGDIDFVSCSPTVYQAMLVDWMRNLEAGIPALLEDGIKVLIYAGEYDLICNWLGKSSWMLILYDKKLQSVVVW